jgi:hypothetical protein
MGLRKKLTNRVNCPSSHLQEVHTKLINNFPHVIRRDVVNSPTAAFEGSNFKESQVGTHQK